MSSTGPLSSNATQKIDADTNNIAPSLGFYVDVDGVLSFRARGDAALRTFAFKAGVPHPIDLLQVDITGSTTIAEVLILRRGAKLS